MKRKNNSQGLEQFLQHRTKRLNNLLRKNLFSATQNGIRQLNHAMRYAVLSGGKRFRPLLIYAIGETYHTDIKLLDPPACAIEMIHSFSLVHDDLPAMDNDSLRRGKPTCHIAFDEATAILTGTAVAIAAFQILSADKNLAPEKKLKMIGVLAEAAGTRGMAGGQYLDLHPDIKPTKHKLEKMYRLKTGALISAAVKLATLAADLSSYQIKFLEQFALTIGLAFQIQDDILNIEGDARKLGKNVGTDQLQNKTTYPMLVGIPKAKATINYLQKKAQQLLRQLNIEDSILQQLTDHIWICK